MSASQKVCIKVLVDPDVAEYLRGRATKLGRKLPNYIRWRLIIAHRRYLKRKERADGILK